MWLICFGVVVVTIGYFNLVRSASDADDEWEKMMRKEIHNESK